MLARIADPGQLDELRKREAPWLAQIASEIVAEGVREPLTLAIDGLGRVCVQDGHHRITVALDGGIAALPVRWIRSEGVRMHSAPACDLAPLLCLAPPPDPHLVRAAEFALDAIEDAGERGWALGDAVCALSLALGRPVSSDARARMESIDPSLV